MTEKVKIVYSSGESDALDYYRRCSMCGCLVHFRYTIEHTALHQTQLTMQEELEALMVKFERHEEGRV